MPPRPSTTAEAASRGGAYPTRIVSVGYEGRSADELAALLLEHDVTTVIDVRLNPISRKPGLTKTRLSLRLRDEGIAYEHLSGLGNPKDNRDNFSVHVSDGAAGRFRVLLGRDAGQQDLATAAALARTGTIALLCFERDPLTCHRHVVATALTDLVPGSHVDAL